MFFYSLFFFVALMELVIKNTFYSYDETEGSEENGAPPCLQTISLQTISPAKAQRRACTVAQAEAACASAEAWLSDLQLDEEPDQDHWPRTDSENEDAPPPGRR